MTQSTPLGPTSLTDRIATLARDRYQSLKEASNTVPIRVYATLCLQAWALYTALVVGVFEYLIVVHGAGDPFGVTSLFLGTGLEYLATIAIVTFIILVIATYALYEIHHLALAIDRFLSRGRADNGGEATE